jgi:hypothetical protein
VAECWFNCLITYLSDDNKEEVEGGEEDRRFSFAL